jgi:Ca-activated chloride channel homolog
MNKVIVFSLGVCVIGVSAFAEDYIAKVQQGNEAFAKKEYSKAVDKYREADLDKPGSPEIEYNVAGGLHALGKYEEAVDTYERALKSPLLPVQAEAHYNLGSTHYRMGDYQKAIESFQEALKINPADMDAKYNLELARKMLKENMKPQDDKQDKNKDQQQKQDQQKQDEQKQDQQKQEEQDKQNDQQDQQDKNKQEQKQQEKPKEISKEDAERILNSLKDDEQKVQKKVRRAVGNGNYSGKDW